MPVSAADEPATMLYNGVELPNIDSVWTNKVTRPYAYICYYTSRNQYELYFAKNWASGLEPGVVYAVPHSSYLYSFGVMNDAEVYSLTGNSWTFYSNYSSIGPVAIRMRDNKPVWSNVTIYDDSSLSSVYFASSAPVDPNAPTPITGTLEILSQQVLDVSASFVSLVSGLSDTSPAFTYGYTLYSDGTEIKSNVSEDSFTGTDNQYLHTTITNLTPETVYEITFTLYADGEPTDITASTSFTTVGSGGAGEGESGTIDYTGQLNDIQQGVDEVGTKLDGVQDTLTETKEEITSLPGKIATAISDMLIGLIVPSEEDLVQLKDSYEGMLGEKLGFVWQSYSLTTTVVEGIHDSMESGDEYQFVFPGIKYPYEDEELVLVDQTTVSLDNEVMDVLRPVFGTAVSLISVIAFINMASDMAIAILSGISMWEFHKRNSYDTASSLDNSVSSSDSYSPW